MIIDKFHKVDNFQNDMKSYKFLAIAALVLLAIVSFFLPSESYYPSFIFTSNHLVFERPMDTFSGCVFWGKLFFLFIFTPAMACAVLQTRLEKNLTALLLVSFASSVSLLFVAFGLCFELFAAQQKFLFGYFLFVGLSAFGCIIFWIMSVREIWHRIRNRRQKLKAA